MSISSLKNQAAFDHINKKGQKFHSPYYTIVTLKSHVTPPSLRHLESSLRGAPKRVAIQSFYKETGSPRRPSAPHDDDSGLPRSPTTASLAMTNVRHCEERLSATQSSSLLPRLLRYARNDVVSCTRNDDSYTSSNLSTSLPLQISLGMKVSKKLGNAVIRNKIKRRVRHLIRIAYDHYNSGLVDTSLSIIFIPKKNFERIEFDILTSAVLGHIRHCE